MYSYIKGIIEEINLDHIVIDNNGIGYKINASANTIMKVKIGHECKIYTKLIVKEDDMSLCGFYDKEELKMFELLTSISKIGPKVGLGILSFASPRQIGAYILSEDIVKLSKAPGVGKKTAERIVLELKDKVDKNNVEFEATPPAIAIVSIFFFLQVNNTLSFKTSTTACWNEAATSALLISIFCILHLFK